MIYSIFLEVYIWYNMNCYKLAIAYDGTYDFGWQEQKDKPSIAKGLLLYNIIGNT